MKLIYTPNSPYARKVRVLIRERQSAHRIEEEIMQPLEEPPALRQVNPAGKVPVLLVPDAEPLTESRVIMEYLDWTLPGGPALPPPGEARWAMLRRLTLADAILDAALAAVFERTRTDAQPSAFWMARWSRAMSAGLARLERQASGLAVLPDLGSIGVGCTLGYLDFRHADLRWRDAAPALAAWFESVVARPSMVETQPG